MDVVGFARELACAHPSAKLPCPICVVTVKAENLDKHLDKVHARIEASPAASWPGKTLLGLLPCRLVLDGDALVLRRFGLKRRVPLDGVIEVGPIYGSRPAAGMSSYGDDFNVPHETIRTGSYLRITAGSRSITIGSKHGTQFAAHWQRDLWRQGGRRRACDVRVDRTSLVAIEYVLARAGRLVPAE